MSKKRIFSIIFALLSANCVQQAKGQGWAQAAETIGSQMVYASVQKYTVRGQVAIYDRQARVEEQQVNGMIVANDRQAQMYEYNACIQYHTVSECRGGSNLRQELQPDSQLGASNGQMTHASGVIEVNAGLQGFRFKILNTTSVPLAIESTRGTRIMSAGHRGDAWYYTYPDGTYQQVINAGINVYDPRTGCSVNIHYWNRDGRTGDWVLQINEPNLTPLFTSACQSSTGKTVAEFKQPFKDTTGGKGWRKN